MKLATLKYQGVWFSFMVEEDVIAFLPNMSEDFLDIQEDREFFEMLFPGKVEYLLAHAYTEKMWKIHRDNKTKG